MKHFLLLVLAGLALVVGSCRATAQDISPDDLLETSVVATVNALNTAAPSATPSPMALPSETPAASATPTPSLTPTATLPWGDFPGPAEASATEIPPPMPELALGPGVVNFILLGSDARPSTGGYRTDTMVLVSIDLDDQTATMISFPRDLYVYVPGWRMDRINTADVRGGFEMTRNTILYNFGIDLDGYVRADFSGFRSAIDTLGGITVQSTGYLTDECGGKIWSYGLGRYEMDGFEALCYVRMRKTTGDFDRLRRQQEVVRALFSKVVSIDGLTRVPQLYNQFYNSVRTDLEVVDLIPLLPSAVRISADSSRIHHFAINQRMASFWRTPGGASVLLPDRPAIIAMLEEAFGPEALAGSGSP